MKRCSRCGEIKPVMEFWRDRASIDGLCYSCKVCTREYKREWAHRTGRQLPMAENKKCSAHLGVHIAERALSQFFKAIKRMPYGNPGYDFKCGQDYMVDVKSACQGQRGSWHFIINRNTIADYFLCLAFDDRDNLNPLHVWLIPGHAVNHLLCLGIYPGKRGLASWVKYEKGLDSVELCCSKMRGYK